MRLHATAVEGENGSVRKCRCSEAVGMSGAGQFDFQTMFPVMAIRGDQLAHGFHVIEMEWILRAGEDREPRAAASAALRGGGDGGCSIDGQQLLNRRDVYEFSKRDCEKIVHGKIAGRRSQCTANAVVANLGKSLG